MEIKLNYHKERTALAAENWRLWYHEYKDLGMTTREIAAAHINPATNKPYTRANIYYGFDQLKKIKSTA